MIAPTVVNLQRKHQVDTDEMRRFAAAAVKDHVGESTSKAFSVAFISDRRMTELNNLFRGKNSTTDVLSFPNVPDEFELDKSNLGDIAISVEQAKRQAEENGLTLENELKQLILHGLLHLCGFDHETDNGEMNTHELKLREKLKI
ncbi:MAG: rRNA maturation RNase YbeY [Pyrinomonadaceae bacterium]